MDTLLTREQQSNSRLQNFPCRCALAGSHIRTVHDLPKQCTYVFRWPQGSLIWLYTASTSKRPDRLASRIHPLMPCPVRMGYTRPDHAYFVCTAGRAGPEGGAGGRPPRAPRTKGAPSCHAIWSEGEAHMVAAHSAIRCTQAFSRISFR
jgi:hypothetical protein